MRRGSLPGNYREYKTVNLQQGRKTSLWVDLTRLGVLLGLGALGMGVLPSVLVPTREAGIQVAAVVLGIMVCLFLHELIHGLMMKIIGGGKLRYGFVGWLPRMGSSDCFSKGSCGVVLLMPWVLLGMLIGAAQWWIEGAWAWTVFAMQVANCVAAVADIWNLAAILKQPAGAMVRMADNQFTVYVPEDYEPGIK